MKSLNIEPSARLDTSVEATSSKMKGMMFRSGEKTPENESVDCLVAFQFLKLIPYVPT